MARTHHQRIGAMGGYKAAQSLGKDGVKKRGSKGGETTLERFGPGHFAYLATLKAVKREQAQTRTTRPIEGRAAQDISLEEIDQS